MAGGFWQSFDGCLLWLSALCYHPVVVFFQIQGCLLYLGLAAGWAYASITRSSELWKMLEAEKKGNSLAFLYPNIEELEHSAQKNLPRVAVVMPLKGLGDHNPSNWRSQVISLYGGHLEFIFVVESTVDPAYKAIHQILLELEGQVEARVVVAGLSTTCSQKIHNQLIGVEAMHKDSKYVLFLDDDIQLHPGSIGALVSQMEEKPEIFVLTGYPFDVPSGTLGSYCIFEYHMPCSIGFATGGRTFFLWGGCMMMHAQDFWADRYGMVTGLRNGGYSDDMTLAAVSGANRRMISSPGMAVFVHPLAENLTFSMYWNYLRKQTFVLESYNTNINWLMNRALLISHCWLSWTFVLPVLMIPVHLAAATRSMLWYSGDDQLHPLSNPSFSSRGLLLTSIILVCISLMLLSLRHLSAVLVKLCNALSPERSPISLDSYNWSLVFIAMVVDNFLYPVSGFYSHMVQFIDWAGVRYHLRKGKVVKIIRPHHFAHASGQDNSHKVMTKTLSYKVPFWSSLSEAYMRHRNRLMKPAAC